MDFSVIKSKELLKVIIAIAYIGIYRGFRLVISG